MAGATKARGTAFKEVDVEASEPATFTGGGSLADVIDENSLQGQIEKNAKQNRATCRGFRQYQLKVIKQAELPNTQAVREITSNVCGVAARLPFVPDNEEKILIDGKETTEFEQQVIRMAAFAEENLNTEAVMTVTARKLARAALELRDQDPDGTRGIAWVNDMHEDEDGSGVLDE